MNKFAEKAESYTGVVTGTDGRRIMLQVNEQVLTFMVEGDVAGELMPGHDVTVVTWGSMSALRVVDHTTNTMYRPYYNADPEGEETLAEANRSPADVPEGKLGIGTLAPAVALATIYQSIPVYGWFVTYKMMLNADKSISGTAPQYEIQAKRYFIFFVVLAFSISCVVFLGSGDAVKAVLAYMTLIYAGTFLLMRHIFKGIEEIDDFARQQFAASRA